MEQAGTDATQAFIDNSHSSFAVEELQKLVIGELVPTTALHIDHQLSSSPPLSSSSVAPLASSSSAPLASSSVAPLSSPTPSPTPLAPPLTAFVADAQLVSQHSMGDKKQEIPVTGGHQSLVTSGGDGGTTQIAKIGYLLLATAALIGVGLLVRTRLQSK